MRSWEHPARWRDDAWYVLMLAKELDVTPGRVLEQTWDEIAAQLDQHNFYRVARGMRHQGNPAYYAREHVADMKRGKL